jgi:hypothetical protein
MALFDEDQVSMFEEARLNVLETRRKQIRGYRLKNGTSTHSSFFTFSHVQTYCRLTKTIVADMVPEMDEDGKPIQSDSKSAVALTAFVVAAGAVALRVGGRAAFISAIGLDLLRKIQS